MPATEFHRIVCLANSRKVSGRCIAGKDIGSGAWLRPVSARPAGEISEEERRYENGTSAQVLDIVDIPIVGPVASGHQTENRLIHPDEYWVKVGSLPPAELAHFADRPETLWKNGHSTAAGKNDRVPAEPGMTTAGSLYLIAPRGLTVHVVSGLRRRVRATFLYRSTGYNWVVTDPIVEKAFLAKPDGDYPLEAAYLCVSLSENFGDGFCYKLVATVF